MGIPWTSHGDFIWAKTHGKLMEHFHDISMGHFYKGTHYIYYMLMYNSRLNEEKQLRSTSHAGKVFQQ